MLDQRRDRRDTQRAAEKTQNKNVARSTIRILAQPRQPRAYQTAPRDYVSGCKLLAATNANIISAFCPCARPLCHPSGSHIEPDQILPAPSTARVATGPETSVPMPVNRYRRFVNR